MINLLPSSAKARLKAAENFRLVAILSTSFWVFLVCLGLMLTALRFYLGSELQGQEFLVASLKERAGERTEERKQIQDLNATLQALQELYAARISPTTLLELLSSHVPSNMYVSTFSMTAEKVAVTGFAATREALLQFRKNMQEDALFHDAYFPPSNWVKQRDITFSFSAKLQ